MEAKQVQDFEETTRQVVVESSQVLAKVLYACNLDLHETGSDNRQDTGWYDLEVFEQVIESQLVAEGYVEVTGALELKALQAIRLEFQYSVQIAKTGHNSRCESEVAVFVDSGNGFAELPDCTRLCYNRQESQGTTTAANAMRPLAMAAGDRLKLRFRKADRVHGKVGIKPKGASFYAKKI